MTQDTNEPCGASGGPKPWTGSRAEKLHDLGMVVGSIEAARFSISDAISIARTHGILPEKIVSTLEEIELSLARLEVSEVSAAAVAELYEKNCGQA